MKSVQWFESIYSRDTEWSRGAKDLLLKDTEYKSMFLKLW